MNRQHTSIMKTLRISFSLKNTYRVNAIIYGLKQIPVVKKLIPESFYAAGWIKAIATVIAVIWEIISSFIGKFLYILLMIFLASSLYDSADVARTYVHILFFLTFIGALINTYIFDPSKDKYYAIVLLRMNAREYAVVNYGYALSKILIGFLVFNFIFGNIAGVPWYINLVIPFFVISCKIAMSAFMLRGYDKKQINMSENRFGRIKVVSVILLLAIAYGLPLAGICIPELVALIVMIAVVIAGIVSAGKIFTFDNYRIVYGQILKDMDQQMEEVEHADLDKNRKMISYDAKSFASDSKLERKRGFEYLNAIFVLRHKKLLMKPIKIVSAICLLLVVAGIAGMQFDSGFKKDIGDLLLKNLGMSTFWMYLINRGMGYTQALFMNCDHSLLNYSFYRKPKSILNLFTIRLREIIKINMIPALILGAGLSVMLYISGATDNPVNYVLVLLVFPAESVFFSVHYMVIYYLLQPYNAGTEIKSGMYKVITGLTYMACYATIQLDVSTFTFGIAMIAFSVLYCIIACTLAYRIAPRTFRIRT
ncbi:hypothetical protein [Agathobacter sp.]